MQQEQQWHQNKSLGTSSAFRIGEDGLAKLLAGDIVKTFRNEYGIALGIDDHVAIFRQPHTVTGARACLLGLRWRMDQPHRVVAPLEGAGVYGRKVRRHLRRGPSRNVE